MKVTVIGDGGWGTALALNLLANHHDVTLWGAFPDYIGEMRSSHQNRRFLPGVELPETLKLESDLAEAVDKSAMCVFATPTQFLRGVLKKFREIPADPRRIIVNVAKGIEIDTWLRISEIIEAELGKVRFVALSGPSHAEEVSRRLPTLVTAASADAEAAQLVQQVFMNDRFRIYTSSDVVGVELGGALKNVMAIAAGVIDGMGLGDNPKAALMTRGISEMGKLGELLGGKASTFSGLSGIGDLIVTCTSGHSRNRHVGEELGRGKKLGDILKEMGMVVAEGVWTAKGAYALSRKVGAETPIIDEIYRVLYEDRDVKEAIHALMTRTAKSEED
ncbi:MAG: NAD(P)H-dependent glycerol-3-phosphate dehydrogenase [Victivallaceae bacterium]|nr:NAD(P)H-dependent glycerol-3-phosphate dehydrogenase [Victivallaceae bacterium]